MAKKESNIHKHEQEKAFLNDFIPRFEEQSNIYKNSLKRLRNIKEELKKLFDEFCPYIEEKNVRQMIAKNTHEPEIREHNTISQEIQENISKLYALWDEYKGKMHENLPKTCDEAIIYLKEKIAKTIVNTPKKERKKKEKINDHKDLDTWNTEVNPPKEDENIDSSNIFWTQEDIFNIIVPEENREDSKETESMLPIIFQEPKQEIQNIPGLWTDIALPEFHTIEDMEEKGEIIPINIQEDISYLESMTSEIDFQKLSISQIIKIKEYVTKIEKMKAKELFDIIKEYMWSIQYTWYNDDIKQKMDKRRTRGVIKEDYIRWPNKDDVEKIAALTLEGLNKKHNIDILKCKLFKSAYESPIITLLVFIKIQKEFNSERTKKISEALIPQFHTFINRYTEFSLKLIFDQEGNKNIRGKKDFFWDQKNEELKRDLKILRSIMYKTELTNSITRRQQNLIMQICEKYKETVKIALMADPEGPYAHLTETNINRGKGNVEMACREILERFDDGTTDRRSHKIALKKNFPTIAEIINSICINDKKIVTKGLKEIMKTGIIIEDLRDFIISYLKSTEKERTKKKEEKIAEFTSKYSYLSPIIVERFFNSIDQYI